MHSDVLPSQTEPSGAGPTGVKTTLKQELDRLARLAARLLGARMAAVCLSGEKGLAINGLFGLEDQAEKLLEILPKVREYHGTERGPSLFTPEAPLPGTPPLASLGLDSLASAPIRHADGELIGCILIAGFDAASWGEEELEDFAGLARLAATVAEGTELQKESSSLEEAVQVRRPIWITSSMRLLRRSRSSTATAEFSGSIRSMSRCSATRPRRWWVAPRVR